MPFLGRVNEYGSAGRARHGARARATRKFVLERQNELAKVNWRLPVGQRRNDGHGRCVGITHGHAVGPCHRSRLALWAQQNGCHQVQPESRQVREIVTSQGLTEQMRVHQPQRAEAAFGGAQAADVWQHEASRSTDNDGVDGSRTVN
jgi:hypothetical protein